MKEKNDKNKRKNATITEDKKSNEKKKYQSVVELIIDNQNMTILPLAKLIKKNNFIEPSQERINQIINNDKVAKENQEKENQKNKDINYICLNNVKRAIVPENIDNMVIELKVRGKVLFSASISNNVKGTEEEKIKDLLKQLDSYMKEKMTKANLEKLQKEPLPVFSNTETLKDKDKRKELLNNYEYINKNFNPTKGQGMENVVEQNDERNKLSTSGIPVSKERQKKVEDNQTIKMR